MALHWQELFGQDKKTSIIDQVREGVGSPPVTLAKFRYTHDIQAHDLVLPFE
jgi:hypothetical protein